MGKNAFSLDRFHQVVLEEVQKLEANGATNSDFFDQIEATASKLIAEVSDSFSANVFSKTKDLQEEVTASRKDFQIRNELRWEASFRELDVLIHTCSELGSFAKDYIWQESDNIGSSLCEAITTLHARSLRVSKEILALMRAGFPDGAMARWRTLHELATIGRFLTLAGNKIAERYIAARICQSKRAADRYELRRVKANLQPFEEKERRHINESYEEVLRLYGDEMKEDLGWARPFFSFKSPKARVTFDKIEKQTGLEHLQPWTKFAHQEVHASFVPPYRGLGVSESSKNVHLVGQSDAGMVDPG
ncbi:DUF5677 domain-containing protein [Leisingera caerulea]|uniref:DUF5677 domain-containing protein n=1 Tax=Leisingera caerulea TaxID=506591 RepID=UPI0012B60761|nr:DUF5677 domain-containing protein [Leisingera caerulea]